jgi:anti-sigma regulatory factor (Ser/Thr protein kinase)
MQRNKPQNIAGLALPCDSSAPRRARAALSGMLGAGPLNSDAALIASELVTNAVKFSGCGAAECIMLDATLDDTSLLITVRDPARTDCVPRVREPEPGQVGGRGLRIVERLARRWGVDDRRDGRGVWALLLLAGY